MYRNAQKAGATNLWTQRPHTPRASLVTFFIDAAFPLIPANAEWPCAVPVALQILEGPSVPDEPAVATIRLSFEGRATPGIESASVSRLFGRISAEIGILKAA